MLRVLGAALVLGSSLLYGWKLKTQLSDHMNQLLAIRELFKMLSGEIAYAKAPLPEAFGRIARRQGGAVSDILLEIAGRMERPGEGSLGEIWCQVWEQHRGELLLWEEELWIIQGMGKNLGYLDIEMQRNHIAMYTGQLEERIAQAGRELRAKQKLYQYLSVTGGLFLILILI
ncbi:MAG: hypothetical protein HFI42_02000 [Lachnospiraceae bacterium]|nr:hypothetical protein [Lachnospiraceae bacterium]MCI9149258.1 hypothetical protein [Lachnospiraceae bacterium]